MQYLALVGTVVVVHILALMSPGPDFIMTLKNSITYSRKTGKMTAIGLGLGVGVHLLYCVAGLAIIISKSILLFNTFKLLGAAYLIFIGLKSMFSKSHEIKVNNIEHKQDISVYKAIKIGFFTNVLNPKATLYFLSLFTLVISPGTPWFIMLVLSFIMIVETMLWFSLVAIFFTHKKVKSSFDKFQGVFNKVFGGLLVALGIKVAFGHK
ncbi:MAG: amino acid transporter [Candidatus Magasanikbacteria bacterium RIFOXYC12_FULL_33_11]|uniref:Amino acid transporter n=1 Tax=Candidatus Magasanikbacteria bacterium RIFOXYC12_FULL_33_11 TaxID=1798701 RepID=A0A1F6NMA9_9BACT|nr:MAG: amino acid transporter [Candidatus Magasanikbacteria bacterium RIFOXYC12_FULL_33_11]